MKTPTIQPGPFTVKLRSFGNPDYGQYTPISNPETVICETLEQAVRECHRYISEWNLGGGNWDDNTMIIHNGKPFARISYNGRLWAPTGERRELTIEA